MDVVLDLTEDDMFPKRLEIYSKYFTEKDFILRSNGKNNLKNDAVPVNVHRLFEISESV